MTILTPLIFLGVIFLVGFITQYNLKDNKSLAVYDESGLFNDIIKSRQGTEITFLPTVGFSKMKDSIERSSQFSGLLYIPNLSDKDVLYLENNIELISKKSPSDLVINYLERVIGDYVEENKLEEFGISQSQLKKAKPEIKFQIKNFEGKNTSAESLVAKVLSFGFMFLMYMFIFIYGARVMRSVLEEKLNRVVEIIISSVKPTQLMLGKIFASILIGLTQLSIWAIISVISSIIFFAIFGMEPHQSPLAPSALENQTETIQSIQLTILAIKNLNIPLILFSFLFYFIFGVLLYNSIFAAIGAAVDNQTDSQQFMIIASVPIILGLYGSLSIFQNPDGIVGIWLSMIPLTSSIAMLARIPFGVPWWQLIISMLSLVLTFYLIVMLAAKIYRVGILMHGKKPGFQDIIKWIRY